LTKHLDFFGQIGLAKFIQYPSPKKAACRFLSFFKKNTVFPFIKKNFYGIMTSQI